MMLMLCALVCTDCPCSGTKFLISFSLESLKKSKETRGNSLGADLGHVGEVGPNTTVGPRDPPVHASKFFFFLTLNHCKKNTLPKSGTFSYSGSLLEYF